MNNKEIFDELGLKKITLNERVHEISDQLESAGPRTLVFYKLKEGESAVELFKKRLNESQALIVIINKKIPNLEGQVYAIDEESFEEKRKILVDKFYPVQVQRLHLFAVTGTNGKSTTCHLAVQLLDQIGKKALAVGTLGVTKASGEVLETTGLTTPSYIQFRKILSKYQSDYDYYFVEVSSHALSQNRLCDTLFDGGGFTSFSQDHLDYHKTPQDYLNAKSLLSQKYIKSSGKLTVADQIEDDVLIQLKKSARCDVCTSSLLVHNFKENLIFNIDYNRQNLAVALGMLESIVSPDQVDYEVLTLPLGRYQVINSPRGTIVIDYAHTPEAIELVCLQTKRAFPNKKLVVLFGCGGNRDKSKRSQMGEKASLYADFVYLTSDNPRDEDPCEIIKDAEVGISGLYKAIVSREEAIRLAVQGLKDEEILLILGKGHETYQEVRGVKIDFDDSEQVRKALV